MERAGLVRLPPPQTRNGNGRRSNLEPTTAPALPWAPGPMPLNPLTDLRLEVVATPAQAALYRQMRDRYHYLGNTPLAGAQMRYLIRCQTTVLGGMGFGASAWSVAVRDRFIGWPPQQRQKQLYLIVNQSRFLLSNSHYDGGSRAGTGRRAGFSPASALCELPGKLFLLIAGLKFPFSVFLCEWTDNKSLRGGWSALKMSR